jgi:hypothetical protein
VSGPTKALGVTSWLWSQIWSFLWRCWSLSLKRWHPTLITCIFTILTLVLLSKNTQGGCLTVNKLTTYINIMHSFDSLYCMPHNVLSFDVSIEEPPFIRVGWNGLRSFHQFFITIICWSTSLGFWCRNPTFGRVWGWHSHSTLGLPKLQSWIAGVKKPRIGMFFISLESYENVDVENGLAWAICTSTSQVMCKRRAGSQIGNLTPDH